MGEDLPNAANIADANMVSALVNHYGTRVLGTLLADRATGGNIMWATDEYEDLGHKPADQMLPASVMGPRSAVIRPRVAKAAERQAARTRGRAEVFTPSWLVNRMANDLDEPFFGRRDAFDAESADGASWAPGGQLPDRSVVSASQVDGHGKPPISRTSISMSKKWEAVHRGVPAPSVLPPVMIALACPARDVRGAGARGYAVFVAPVGAPCQR